MRIRSWLGVVVLVACGGSVGMNELGGGGKDTEPALPAPVASASTTSSPTGEGASTPKAGGDVDASTNADASAGSPPCRDRSVLHGDVTRKVVVAGKERAFTIHAPPQNDGSARLPAVFAFHGWFESSSAVREASHFDLVGDARGFVTVFPDGVSQSWNADTCCGVAQATGVDDLAFTRAMLDAVDAEFCIDIDRIYASGFSNGGFFAHRLACEMSSRFAAIAVHSAQNGATNCAPPRAVPVLQVHGTADFKVPYGGNPIVGFSSTQTTIDGWIARNGCAPAATPGFSQGRGQCNVWSSCRDRAQVELCTVEGLGHSWSGGGDLWRGATPPTEGFVATLHMADFLLARTLR